MYQQLWQHYKFHLPTIIAYHIAYGKTINKQYVRKMYISGINYKFTHIYRKDFFNIIKSIEKRHLTNYYIFLFQSFRQNIPIGVIPLGSVNRFAKLLFGTDKDEVRLVLLKFLLNFGYKKQ